MNYNIDFKKNYFWEDLFSWFDTARRDFPWRETSNPYKILVAEKLLQQTMARKVVVLAYKQMIHTYPTPEYLANANLDDLERIIRPLGLVFRGKQLQTMANELVKNHSSKVPHTLKELLKLTGIGQYCARAVLSFAYGEDIAVVDTNVARFLHRFYAINKPMPANPSRNLYLIRLAQKLVPNKKSKDFNLAILDLCALICKPKNPICNSCPVNTYCAFQKQTLTSKNSDCY